MATENIFDNQTVPAALSYLAADGVTSTQLPAGIIPSWNLVDPDATLTMTVSADGQSAQFQATGKDSTTTPGAVLTVNATLANGTVITGSAVINVSAVPPPAPASIVITFGTPVSPAPSASAKKA